MAKIIANTDVKGRKNTIPSTKEVTANPEVVFGSGCFTCPGSKTEDIAFGAMMHNTTPDKIIEELNEAIQKKAEENK